MNFQSLSINSFFTFALVAALFYAIFLIIEHFLIPWIPKEKVQRKVTFFYPAFRNMIWILLLLDFIYENAETNLYLTIVMLALAVGLLFKPLKDLVMGIIFRFQKGDLRGQSMQVGEFNGEVFSYSNTRLNIKLDNGEIVQVPFHEAASSVIVRSAENKNLSTINLSVKISAEQDIEVVKNDIRKLLINSPYVLSHQGIRIEQKEINNDLIELSILVFSNHIGFKNNIQKRLYALTY